MSEYRPPRLVIHIHFIHICDKAKTDESFFSHPKLFTGCGEMGDPGKNLPSILLYSLITLAKGEAK